MTEEMRELEFELGSKGDPQSHRWETLVPIHVDNFALALASGYVGGSLKGDAAQDLQAFNGNDLLGFCGEVPLWAILEGESGDRVLLCFEREGAEVPELGAMERCDGPLRITRLKKAYFKSEESLANFVASYDAFPDVPINVTQFSTNWPVSEAVGRPSNLHQIPIDRPDRRQDLDFFGGFAAGLVELLAEGNLDNAISSFLRSPGNGILENGRNFLIAIEPRSSQSDVAIWTATIEALRARFGKRGFDRREFLADVEQRLTDSGSEVESWIRGCQKVIDAEIDIPSFADSEKAGRRAALALILSHEPSGLEDIENNLGAGPRVRALVAVAAYAFAGLSRIDEKFKSPSGRMDAVLEIGEKLETGEPVQLSIQTIRTDQDLTRHQMVSVGSVVAVERQIEPPAYMLMLKARIQEAGYKVEVDGRTGQIGIRPNRLKGDFITVEDCPSSVQGNPIVNLVLPLAILGARPSVVSLKKYMMVAWKNSTTVALREAGECEEVVAMASLPLATLDRDELNFHVERLLQVSEEFAGGKRRNARAKK